MNDPLTTQTDQLTAPHTDSTELDAPVPLGVGNFEDQISAGGLGEGLSTGRRIDTTSLLIAGVVIVAAVALFSMSKLATLAMPTGGNKEVEEKVEGFVKKMTTGGSGTLDSTDIFRPGNHTVLTVLSEDYQRRQVQLGDIQKNPFINPGAVPAIKTDAPVQSTNLGPTEEEQFAARRQNRLEEIHAAADRFKLKSVLMGNPPLANLNGKVVRLDESVMVHPEEINFKVTKIEDGVVTLTTSDEDLDLVTEIVVTLARQ